MSDETPDTNAASPAGSDKPTSAVAALKNLAASSGLRNNGRATAPEAALAKAAEAQSEAETKAEAEAVAETKGEVKPDPQAAAAQVDAAKTAPRAPAARPHTPVVKTGPGSKKVSGVTPVATPVTAGEYARTTGSTAANTAVIPVVKDDQPAQAPSPAQVAVASAGRQASLKLVRVDPWSVTKVVFALTVALMIVAVVAVTILWIVLSFAGVWDQINSSVTTVLSDDSSSFDITQYLGFTRIVGLTLVIAAINVVITTAVATIGAYLYNLAAQLLGGVDVTLAEED